MKARMKTIDLKAALRAVEAEPELTGHISDELWDVVREDRAAVEEALRQAVRGAKDGIAKRLMAMGR